MSESLSLKSQEKSRPVGAPDEHCCWGAATSADR